MDNVFYSSLDKKKLYLKKWVESKDEYKRKRKVIRFFQIASILVFLICTFGPVPILIGGMKFTVIVVMMSGFGFIMALIPYLIAGSMQISAFKEASHPYENMEKECLRVYEDGIEHLFHDTSNLYPESMCIYRIPIENITAIRYDKEFHTLMVIGEGEFLTYDNYADKRLNHQKSQRRFYWDSQYFILAAFEEEDRVITLLDAMVKRKREEEDRLFM